MRLLGGKVPLWTVDHGDVKLLPLLLPSKSLFPSLQQLTKEIFPISFFNGPHGDIEENKHGGGERNIERRDE